MTTTTLGKAELVQMLAQMAADAAARAERQDENGWAAGYERGLATAYRIAAGWAEQLPEPPAGECPF